MLKMVVVEDRVKVIDDSGNLLFDNPLGESSIEISQMIVDKVNKADSLEKLKLSLQKELDEAERKANDSLKRYKFLMFGYWAAIWVHINRIGDFKKPNPWSKIVKSDDDGVLSLPERPDVSEL